MIYLKLDVTEQVCNVLISHTFQRILTSSKHCIVY